MPGAVTGVVASIRWSYYDAAAIHGYVITRDRATDTWTVSGTIVLADAFKLSQRPLRLVAPFQGGAWEWTILDPVPRVAGPFTARLSKPLPR